MLKIKRIKIFKSKVKITFDDGDVLEIDKSIYPNFYLYEGKQLDKKELEKIKTANDGVHLMNYALKLRQKALYTEKKMREKLYLKGASKAQVDYIIMCLKEADLIDDEAFIEEFIEYYNSLNYGKNKIKNKLVEKGIPFERVEKIKFPIIKEKKKAQNVLPKLERKYAKYNDKQKKQHIYNAYLSLGFDNEIAKEIVEQIKEDNPKEEYKKLERDFDKIYLRYKKKYEKKELRNKIVAYLLSKGYKFKDIVSLLERKGI